ncbi:hypothetical protein FJT64_024960 [Amphibalanus amphitrite]|uniref:Glutamate receptor ionotropic, delta-1 n=1 Tax=Amphibalanus amphitrite TaxID=1232801 RepID=A0A6A4W6Q7_AMPAM|nr:hypothetical protein FJT64_024960 [Amphibalanus amphitrite]
MDALTEPAVCRCVAELVARLHWGSVSLQAPPGAALLLAPLLLAVARRGVFVSVAPDADRAADGAVLPTDSLAAVANGRGRPLLVLALRGTSERRLATLLRPLGGALVYDVLSGAVYRTARYADVGPPVQRLGTCQRRGVRLSDDIGRPSPIGWQDLRLVNTTIKAFGYESFKHLSVFSSRLTLSLADMMELLEDTMFFKLTYLDYLQASYSEALFAIKNGTAHTAVDYFMATPDRAQYLSFPFHLGKVHICLFFGQPPAVSHASLLGGPFAEAAGRLLLAGLTLLLVLLSYLATRGSSGGGPAGSWLQAVALFSNQGLAARPSRLWQLVAAGVGCLAALLTAQLYTAGLLSRVTTEVTELPFKQLDDVLDAPGWQWGFLGNSGVQELLVHSSSPGVNFAGTTASIMNKPYMKSRESFIEKGEQEQFAFFYDHLAVASQCNWETCPKLCYHPQELASFGYSVPFRRDDPAVPAWYVAFLRLWETGIWSRLKRRHMARLEEVQLACDVEPRPRQYYAPLELEQCVAAFTLLLGGAALACGFLASELVIARLTAK